MIDTLQLYHELRQAMDAAAAEKIAETIGRVYEELRNSVTKTEFNDLRQVVGELAEAQKRTEKAVEELAEAQKRTEKAVEELAAAQKRTERAVEKLAEQVGGLSETVGGDIEDIAYIVLHDVLKREYGWRVGLLERRWQTWGKEPEEVNILGQAVDPARPDATLWIVGEAKHNLTAREVKRFTGQLDRARKNLTGEIFPVCFCYRARPEVQQMVQEAGIHLVFSYGKIV